MSLYKYQSTKSEWFLENLQSGTLFFSSPRDFNDPFDCRFTYRSLAYTPEEIEKIRQRVEGHSILGVLLRQELASKSTAEIVSDAEIGTRHSVERFVNEIGICCFSKCHDNLLMWSHYADNAAGICLEFSEDVFGADFCHGVRYSNEYPQLDLAKIYKAEGQSAEIFYPVCCTKSLYWKYEEEVRVVWKHGSRKPRPYPIDKLTGLYFGPRICQDTEEEIMRILASRTPQVNMWKGHLSESRYEIVFERMS